MPHLDCETLARLVDERADPAEAAHLRECAVCRDELDALREQTRMLAALPDPHPGRDGWPALEDRIREQETIGIPRPRWAGHGILLRAAALAALLAGGAALALRDGERPLSRAPSGALPAPVGSTQAPAGSIPRLAIRTPDALPPLPPGRTEAERGSESVATAPESSSPSDPVPSPAERTGIANGDDAAYLQALALQIQSAAQTEADPVERLALWEGIALSTATALERAPADPLVNGYHLLVLRERDATRVQVARGAEQPWY